MTTYHQTWEALAAHFGEADIQNIVSSRRQFGAHLLPDVQQAIAAELEGLSPTLCGVHQPYDHLALTFSTLLVRAGDAAIALTPLQYNDIDVGEAEPFAALGNGLWLFAVGGEPAAVLLSEYFDYPSRSGFAQVEIACLPGRASVGFQRTFLEAMQRAGETSRLYRGKVLSFEGGADASGMRAAMQVHRLPAIPREAVVLDAATMGRLDRHVFEFDRQRAALKRLGQSVKKGLLLYGPPGTGKTHVIRYIASNLAERTTVLVTAEQIKMLSRYMMLARTLQPSIVVLEDVDLVGRSRDSMNSPNTEVLLNRLLNEMDGLGEEADVLFILTTNRPDDIEDALASRPGRVDEAIEIANPDADCRARLVELYGRSLSFEDGTVEDVVRRSAGASAAFIKEMVRRLAQSALSQGASSESTPPGGGARIGPATVAAVLGEATASRSRIGRRIVGLAAAPETGEGREARDRRSAPPFDGCGEDL